MVLWIKALTKSLYFQLYLIKFLRTGLPLYNGIQPNFADKKWRGKLTSVDWTTFFKINFPSLFPCKGNTYFIELFQGLRCDAGVANSKVERGQEDRVREQNELSAVQRGRVGPKTNGRSGGGVGGGLHVSPKTCAIPRCHFFLRSQKWGENGEIFPVLNDDN